MQRLQRKSVWQSAVNLGVCARAQTVSSLNDDQIRNWRKIIVRKRSCHATLYNITLNPLEMELYRVIAASNGPISSALILPPGLSGSSACMPSS